MREWVGRCKRCGKDVYCNDGFFTGVVLEDKSVVCFDCEEQQKREPEPGPHPGPGVAHSPQNPER